MFCGSGALGFGGLGSGRGGGSLNDGIPMNCTIGVEIKGLVCSVYGGDVVSLMVEVSLSSGGVSFSESGGENEISGS